MDADPRFNEYPPHEEFVEGLDWVPGQIPPQIRSPEYSGNSSDASSDTQASRIIQALSVMTSPCRPKGMYLSVVGPFTRFFRVPEFSGYHQWQQESQ